MKKATALLCSLPLLITAASLSAGRAQAQRPIDPATNVVSIEATAMVAEETSNPFRRLSLQGRFTISRTGPTNNSLSAFVIYSGTAKSGTDYTALPWFVNIPAGSISIDLNVVAIPDEIAEPIEIIHAELSECPPLTNPAMGIPCRQLNIDPARGSARVFIRDDGITTASLEVTSPAEGTRFNAGATIPIRVTAIDLEGAITTVDFLDGDSRIGQSQIAFIQQPPPGSPIQHQFDWTGAAVGEHALNARAVAASGEAVRSARVAILVGSSAPLVRLEATVPQTTEPSLTSRFAPGVFRLSRTGSTSQPLRVSVGYRGTATPGLDYDRLPGMVEIPAGAVSTELQVVALDDALVEGDETVIAEISAPAIALQANYRIEPDRARAQVVIHDNDLSTTPVVRIEASVPETSEPAPHIRIIPGAFTLHRTGSTAAPLWVFLSYRGTATAGHDYQALPASVQFPAGAASAVLIVGPHQDNLVEGDETVVAQVEPDLTMGPIARYRVDPSHAAARVVIHDAATTPPARPQVRIAATDSVAREGATATTVNTATFTIRRSGPTDAALTVHFEVGGRAINAVDYQELRSPLTIPAGQPHGTLTVIPIDDALAEHAESVVVKLVQPPVLSPLPDYTIGSPHRAAAVILDNDRPRPHCARLPDGLFNLCIPVNAHGCFRIEGSDDLIHWVTIGTVEAKEGAVDFIDTDGPDHAHRFYRAVPDDCDP